MGLECVKGILEEMKEFQSTYREINPRYAIFTEKEIDEEKLPPEVKVIKASDEEFQKRMIQGAWEVIMFNDRLQRKYSYCGDSEALKAMRVIDTGASKANNYMNTNNLQKLAVIFEPKKGSKFDYLDLTIACLQKGVEVRQAREDAERTQEYYRTSSD